MRIPLRKLKYRDRRLRRNTIRSNCLQKRKHRQLTLLAYNLAYKLKMGEIAAHYGLCFSLKLFGVKRGHLYYWKRKFTDATFHPNFHGGKRYTKFNEFEQNMYEMCLCWSMYSQPTAKLKHHRVNLHLCGISVSTEFISRTLKRWRWNYKKPVVKQIQKYTPENIAYYGVFLEWVFQMPWNRLKFLDESHFAVKELLNQCAIGEHGEVVTLINPQPFDVRYSLTAMTTLTGALPIISDLRSNANNAQHFLAFILYLIEDGHLQPGDILILDNAQIHKAAAIITQMYPLVTAAGVQIIFLPKYSSELNPIELVFNVLKTYIRNSLSDEPLYFQIIKSISTITRSMVQQFYYHCLQKWFYE